MALKSGKTMDLERLQETVPIFRVAKQIVTTAGQSRTNIILQVESTAEQKSTVYGVSFTLSNREYFEDDGVASVPMITGGHSVQFQMTPKKMGFCQLRMTVVFTTADGETRQFAITDDSNLLVHPLSFLSPLEGKDFATVWAEGEESRFLSPLKFPAFFETFSTTVFGQLAEKDTNSIQGTAITPDGKCIAVRAIASGNVTAVQFKAPSLELLSLVDDFLRGMK
jgi:hypothetical protein